MAFNGFFMDFFFLLVFVNQGLFSISNKFIIFTWPAVSRMSMVPGSPSTTVCVWKASSIVGSWKSRNTLLTYCIVRAKEEEKKDLL